MHKFQEIEFIFTLEHIKFLDYHYHISGSIPGCNVASSLAPPPPVFYPPQSEKRRLRIPLSGFLIM